MTELFATLAGSKGRQRALICRPSSISTKFCSVDPSAATNCCLFNVARVLSFSEFIFP
jgi:hypothetical protein